MLFSYFVTVFIVTVDLCNTPNVQLVLMKVIISESNGFLIQTVSVINKVKVSLVE